MRPPNREKSVGRFFPVDMFRWSWFNNQAVYARPYLSWIEDLTTNQGVVGSNPTGRASETPGQRLVPLAFLLLRAKDCL